jgi:tRNA pseudouridine32 synthase/23S rRNA pseudouridine746 synthase
MPVQGPWVTLREHLVTRLPRVDPQRIEAMLNDQLIVGLDGPKTLDSPFEPDSFIWFHRDLPEEAPVPFDIDVLHRDDDLLVVDKPHFLATIPRGQHILETALVRLRRQLELPALIPAHRLDRVTAGLVLFIITPERRGAYQNLFRDRLVHKGYEAIAPFKESLSLPQTIKSRIVKERGVIAAQEVSGDPNSETLVEIIEQREQIARYRLTPKTGRTHQLRLHMSSLGIPILGDDFYPRVTEKPLDDFGRPLQLLAKTLRFQDPLNGELRQFESRRSLQSWYDFAAWQEPWLIE